LVLDNSSYKNSWDAISALVLISFSIDEITPASLIKLFLIKSIAPDPAFNAVLSSVGNDLDKIILICFETSVLKHGS
jgi:hypothetical protein